MSEVTLETLARRVEALERALNVPSEGPRPKDWRQVVGLFEDSAFMRQIDAEGQAIREAERAGAGE